MFRKTSTVNTIVDPETPLDELLNNFNEVVQWKIKKKEHIVVAVGYKKTKLGIIKPQSGVFYKRI